MGSGASRSLTIPVVFADQSNNQIASFKTSTKKNFSIKDPYIKLKPNYNKIPLGEFKPEIIDNITVVHGVVGLKNLGNTCYFNSAIHCLSHTKPLLDYILSRLYEKEINKSSKLGSKGQVTICFAQLLSEIWKDERSVGVSSFNTMSQTVDLQKKQKQYENWIDPSRLLSLISRYSKRFDIGQQEDCQELLSYLLDIIHEDLNRCQKKQQIYEKDYIGEVAKDEWAAEAWGEHLKINKSIIVDLFQGQLKSNVKCNTCGYQSHKWEPFLFLNLPIKQQQQQQQPLTNSRVMTQGTSQLKQETFCQLTDCLDLFQKEETLNWKCPKCKENRDCTKGIRIWKLPNILIVHLKRFEYGPNSSGKIQQKVDFPIQNLDMSPYCVEQSNPMYDLYAIAQHHGSLQYGHYVAICKHRNDDQWYMYNDDAVYKIQDVQKTIVNEYSYVLFYQKQTDAILRQTVTDPTSWPHNQKPVPHQLQQSQLKVPQIEVSKQQSLTLMDYEETEQRGHMDESPRDPIKIDPLAKREQPESRKLSQNQSIRESGAKSNSIYRRSNKVDESQRFDTGTSIGKIEQEWGFGVDQKIQTEMDKKVQNKFVEMRSKASRK